MDNPPNRGLSVFMTYSERREVMPKVTIDACAACHKKDGTMRAATEELYLGGKTWFLCEEHEASLSPQLVAMLGEPCEVEDK